MAQPHSHPDRTRRDDAEREWVAAIRRGDESAFAALFTAYYEPLWALVNDYVHAPDTAEEVVQDIFFRLWAQRTTWQVRGSVRGYLYSAARSRAIDQLRRERRENRWAAATGTENPPDIAGGEPSAGPDARLAAAELSAALDQAIERLSPALREVLVLRARHHLTYPEIAGVLDVSPKAVEVRVTRAFRQLREYLKPYID